MISGPNSGTSTPRGSVTPTPSDGNAGSASGNAAAAPTAASPNPLTVGTHFVKQYYKVLSTTPDQIFRFYQSSSVLSQGVGSQLPTPPSTLEASGMDAVKDRFVLPGFEGCPIRFEFEHGAIDAQLSVNGGVLLVVTGHLVYVDSAVDNGNSSSSNSNHRHRNGEDTRKAFVHTFFLGSTTAGSKRSYYVHNDILRFLHDANDVEESTVVASNISPKASSKKVAQPDEAIIDGTDPAAALAVAPLPLAVETNHVTLEPPSTTLQKLSLEEGPGDDAPGGGVEESKDVAVDEVAAAPAVAVEQFATSEKEPQWSSGAATPVAKEDEPKAAAAARPTPGSWASLVASGSNSTPATPTRASAITPVRAAPSSAASKPVPSSPAVKVVAAPTPPSGAAPAASATIAAAGSTPAPDAPRPPAKFVKRDPDCTLVIKNIDSDTTEADVLAVFESFATSADAKVVSLTVSGHKGIAFVDYDSSAPVLAAVAQHGKEPFQMNGRELDVYQKTLEKMNRKASGRGGGGGGGFRGGGAPGNGSAGRGGDRGSGPGGRKPYGRGGRGDRDRGGERGGRGGR